MDDISVTALNGRVTANGVTGHLCLWLFVPPILACYLPFRYRLGSGTRQTDGQTDNDRQCIMPPPYGGGA